ncbi:protein-glutamate methylesterase [Mycobacterium lehmannii]|uniref:protein-glutamate methylesterase n=1 Tax=Mycobacterium lehmannii TaxID=2048550 RepID=A0A101A0X0_9MYCO|nr:chemotaxis protein CheB [Mycobacterium lehmannii]KUI09205.1 protein-glutamate methylesterase [Mycobacterium lehmannii]
MPSEVDQLNGAPHGVVVVGASAGGVEALTQLAANLPEDLPYAVLVTLHMPASAPSVLARIIDRAGPLSAMTATDGEALKPGQIHVAVPDRHLLVYDHRVMLSEGPTENGHRPAINALFRSAALHYGPRSIGVVLSGVLDDGVLGAAAIRSRGGITVVQDPDDALFPGMPHNALRAGAVDHRAPAREIGALLSRLSERDIQERDMEPDSSMELENRIAMGTKFSTSFDSEALGPPSGYTCPDCNGSLSAMGEQSFRCQVGHAWTADALLSARDEEIDGALWVALRSLQEKAKLSRRMADNAGPGMIADRYNEWADEAEHAMEVLGKRLSEARTSTGGPGA